MQIISGSTANCLPGNTQMRFRIRAAQYECTVFLELMTSLIQRRAIPPLMFDFFRCRIDL